MGPCSLKLPLTFTRALSNLLDTSTYNYVNTTTTMATTDGLPPDPLALLRSSIADSTLPIPTSTSDATTAEQSLAAAGYLVFNQNGQHISIPLSQETRFISVASGKPAVMSATRVEELTKGSGGKHGQNNKNNSFVSPSCGYLMI